MQSQTSLSLKPGIKEAALKIAATERRSLSFIVNELLTEAIQGREKLKNKKGGNS